MRLIYLTCVTILFFLTSLTLEVNAGQDFGSTQTGNIENPKWSTEGNKKEYATVLELSFYFFEAMRSGKLPKDNRISWRGASMMDDCGLLMEDLTGGYYTAGDTYVKYAFPMAFTTTMLSWGVLLWPEAYRKAGQLNEMYKAIKWATDYFIKCHTHEEIFYIQVGSTEIESHLFSRPEDTFYDRPAYFTDCHDLNASDILGEVTAALAAASVVYKDIFHNDWYSNRCLTYAQELYRLATRCTGSHYDRMPDSYELYELNALSFYDDLIWAALWLYKATKNYQYLQEAEILYWAYLDRPIVENHRRFAIFDYYSKLHGIDMMLSQFSVDIRYKSFVSTYFTDIVHSHFRTQKGLLFLKEWDTLSLTANAAFLCLVAASSDNNDTRQCYSFAKHQIDYMLGLLKESERSYVVGYGSDPPSYLRHKATRCPITISICEWRDANPPNQQILYGALVSGPDANDYFNDTRDSTYGSKYTQIRLHYNAGFTGALAGLLQLNSND